MKILYLSFGSIVNDNTIENMKRMGHKIKLINVTGSLSDIIQENVMEYIEKELAKTEYDCAFSYNYSATTAQACMNCNVKYISWVYDSPCDALYSSTVYYETNYIYVFDSFLVKDLKKKGVKNIYYMPLGANVQLLESIQENQKDRAKYETDISFIGSMYMNRSSIYNALSQYSKDRQLIGYIDGLMEVQRRVYGVSVIQDCLNQDIIERITPIVQCHIEEGSMHTPEYLFATHGFSKKIASIERAEILYKLSQKHQVDLYTDEKELEIGLCNNRGRAHYNKVAPKVFRYSKINLNITLRSIQTGVPLRAIDIMGAGGFLLTNYQEDFQLHFEPDKDFVQYESYEELEDKVDFYLKHEDLRNRIAQSGQKKVLQELDYQKLLKRMFETANLKAVEK